MRLTRLTALASSMALAAGLVVSGAAGTGTALAVTCSGFTCHGRDPMTYLCSASITAQTSVVYQGETVAILQDRYSGNCNSNWARAELTTAGLNHHYRFIINISTTDREGSEFMCYPVQPDQNGAGLTYENCSGGSIASGGWWYTDMVDGTFATLADIGIYDPTGMHALTGTTVQN